MTKKYWLILALILVGCGEQAAPKSTTISHTFSYQGKTWQIQIPETWEILAPDRSTLFMARNGDENVAILERDLSSNNPAEQIINSAKNDFFSFNLENQSQTAWAFNGKPTATTIARNFWQQIESLPEANKFLLASCSQHQDSPIKSSCASILKSWKLVE